MVVADMFNHGIASGKFVVDMDAHVAAYLLQDIVRDVLNRVRKRQTRRVGEG